MSLVKLIEPPCTERYARWCERSGNLFKFPSYSIAAEDFGPLPSPGRLLDLDGKKYQITEAADEDGIYSISLEVPRS